MDKTDLQRLIDGGVYDPDDAEAEDRRAVIDFLAELGTSVDEMLDVARVPGGLAGLASLAGQPEPTVSLAGLARQMGQDSAYVAETWLAMGLVLPPIDKLVLSDDEADRLATIGTAMAFMSDDHGQEVLRTVGRSIARIADSMIQAYITGAETTPTTELGRAQLAVLSSQLLGDLLRAIEVILIRHLTQSAVRLRSSRRDGDEHTTLAVGFVDLVGFTPLSMTLEPNVLAEFLDEFEDLATEHVTANGGWVVKLIGDAVMFAAVEVGAALRISAALLDALGGPGRAELTPTGGLAYGHVLARAGDYFGPVVNTAARLSSVSIPNEILITQAVNREMARPPDGFVVEPAGRRLLKGFEEAVLVSSLRRDDGGSSGQVRSSTRPST